VGVFPFPIVLVPRYKLSLCHTPIKPDLLIFSRINIFVCGLHDHVVTRFTSSCIKHPRPHRLQWLNECGEVKVTKQVSIAFAIGK
jgi:hypothetical protein